MSTFIRKRYRNRRFHVHQLLGSIRQKMYWIVDFEESGSVHELRMSTKGQGKFYNEDKGRERNNKEKW